MVKILEESVIAGALGKRSQLFADPATNAFRLIDDEGDQSPGITVDLFDGLWLVSTKGEHLPAIFRTARDGVRSLYWKRLGRERKAAPEWVWGERVDAPFVIKENGLLFEVSLQAGYSQGIFLDQRENRALVLARAQPGQRLLNTFSYTGAFSIAAARKGAITTSLDLSNTYLAWAKRNFRANGLDPDKHFFCLGDALSWMRRFAKQGRQFAGVILDPPTFSRSKTSVFRVRKDYARLVQAGSALAVPGGWILATCNDRELTHQRFESLIREGLRSGERQIARFTSTAMPPDFTGESYLRSVWIDLRG